MSDFPDRIEELIKEISSLPGIGPKSAERISLYILSKDDSEVEKFVNIILKAKENMHLCPVCFNITDKKRCNVCADSNRNHSTICVVEEVRDLFAIEKGKYYDGVFHVLHGRIDPMNHISPENLKMKELIKRVSEEGIKEVIIATNPNFNGDITALYIQRVLKPYNIRITRIAIGLPKGTEIDFVDSVTLSMAIKDRKEI